MNSKPVMKIQIYYSSLSTFLEVLNLKTVFFISYGKRVKVAKGWVILSVHYCKPLKILTIERMISGLVMIHHDPQLVGHCASKFDIIDFILDAFEFENQLFFAILLHIMRQVDESPL